MGSTEKFQGYREGLRRQVQRRLEGVGTEKASGDGYREGLGRVYQEKPGGCPQALQLLAVDLQFWLRCQRATLLCDLPRLITVWNIDF